MQIFDDDDHRPAGGNGGQELGPPAGQLCYDCQRSGSVEGIVGKGNSGSRRERENRAFSIRGCDPCAGQQLAGPLRELLLRVLAALVERNAARLPDDLCQRPVHDPLTHCRAAPSEKGNVWPFGLGEVEGLAQQPALADACWAVDHREPWRPRFDRLVEEASQDCELSLPADDARPQVARRPALERAFDPAFERMGDDGYCLALDLELDGLPECEELAGGAVGSVADEGSPGRGCRLKAGGDVQGVAGDRGVAGACVCRCDDFARVNANPDRQLDGAPCSDFRRQIGDPIDDLGRRADSSRGVVLSHSRNAEHGYNRVADVLLDSATPGLDDRRDEREVRLQEGSHLLGIQAVGELRRVHEVDEQRRRELPFVRRGLGGQRMPARLAEARFGGDL